MGLSIQESADHVSEGYPYVFYEYDIVKAGHS